MPRLTILAIGNGDVRDSLHVLRENGAVAWNGVNAVLRARHRDWSARVIHRTMTRSDAVLASDGIVPTVLAGRDMPREPYAPASQYALDLFETPADIVVLSIQPDVMNLLCRHKDDGHHLYPYDLGGWPAEDQQWLAADYRPLPMLEPDESIANLARIIARLRARRAAPILVFNMSAAMPWERVRSYRGLGETLGERIRRFNLALIGLSRDTGIAIVDVDAVIAGTGARGLKVDPVTLTAEGCRLVAEEVVDILTELGVFGAAEAA